MSDEGYKGGGPTVEGMWAFVVGGLVGIPVFMFLLIGYTLGDCLPDEDCKPSVFVHVVLPSLAIGGAVAFAAWWLVKMIRKNGR